MQKTQQLSASCGKLNTRYKNINFGQRRRRREIFAIYTVYTMDLYWFRGAAEEKFFDICTVQEIFWKFEFAVEI